MKRLICMLTALIVIGSASLFAEAKARQLAWYVPLDQVPAVVLNKARATYPQAQIWAVKMEHYNVYEVKMSNFMELYIDAQGNLLWQEWDD